MTNKGNFDFDYNPQAEQPNPASPKLEMWDILSILVLLMTCGIVVYFGMIFFDPASPMNPLPPVVVTAYHSPTPTITPLGLEPTWTPPPTPVQSPSATLAPTFTPIPSATLFSLTPASATPTVTNTPKAPFSATVGEVQSDIFPHLQAAACNWQGVGGSVVDANNSDIIGMTVRLVGSYNGKTVDIPTVSGIITDYGRSGFEFVLGTTPITSKGKLYLQLLDQTSGLPLADNVYIDTSSDCKKNLVLVHFKKNR
jgi:hypothetical protein